MVRTIGILTLLAALLMGCSNTVFFSGYSGNGVETTSEREVEHFEAIRIFGDFRIFVDGESDGTIKVNGDENLLDYIKTVVSNNRLYIYVDNNANLRPTSRIEIHVPGKYVKDISAGGSSSIALTSFGNERLHYQGEANTLLVADGNTNSLIISLTDNSRVVTRDLLAYNTVVTTSGSSRAEIHASESLYINSSGSSLIQYHGNPAMITNNNTDSSSVRPAG